MSTGVRPDSLHASLFFCESPPRDGTANCLARRNKYSASAQLLRRRKEQVTLQTSSSIHYYFSQPTPPSARPTSSLPGSPIVPDDPTGFLFSVRPGAVIFLLQFLPFAPPPLN